MSARSEINISGDLRVSQINSEVSSKILPMGLRGENLVEIVRPAERHTNGPRAARQAQRL